MTEFKPDEKPMSEAETRKSIFKQARRFLGPEAERQVRHHFDKYDNLLKECRNESEKEHIKIIALAELYKLMHFQNGLAVNGKEIIPADPEVVAKLNSTTNKPA